MFFWTGGGLFSLFVPIIIFIVGFRVLRYFLRDFSRNRHTTFDEYKPPVLPIDDTTTQTHYEAEPLRESYEHEIFKLADEAKGRLTVSDIVIGTDLGLKDAERVIDELVDGIHITMEVTGEGRVIYEFPEIIAKYRDDENEADDSSINEPFA